MNRVTVDGLLDTIVYAGGPLDMPSNIIHVCMV